MSLKKKKERENRKNPKPETQPRKQPSPAQPTSLPLLFFSPGPRPSNRGAQLAAQQRPGLLSPSFSSARSCVPHPAAAHFLLGLLCAPPQPRSARSPAPRSLLSTAAHRFPAHTSSGLQASHSACSRVSAGPSHNQPRPRSPSPPRDADRPGPLVGAARPPRASPARTAGPTRQRRSAPAIPQPASPSLSLRPGPACRILLLPRAKASPEIAVIPAPRQHPGHAHLGSPRPIKSRRAAPS